MKPIAMPEKMKQRTLWAVWCFVLGGAALWLLVGSVAYWVKHGWLPADTSGWVQALGSLLAVAVAIAVPACQRRRERQLAAINEHCKRVENIQATLFLAGNLLSRFESAGKYLSRSRSEYVDRLHPSIQLLARDSSCCADVDLLAFGIEMVPFLHRLKSAALYPKHADGIGVYAWKFAEVSPQVNESIRELKLIYRDVNQFLEDVEISEARQR